jgi:hypothetical protein
VRSVDPSPDFEKFWQAYPRKVAKGAARKAWAKLQKVLPAVEVLIEAAKKQGEVYKSRPSFHYDGWAFFPHASTWLNAERWTDEIERPKALAKKTVWDL